MLSWKSIEVKNKKDAVKVAKLFIVLVNIGVFIFLQIYLDYYIVPFKILNYLFIIYVIFIAPLTFAVFVSLLHGTLSMLLNTSKKDN